MKTTALYLHRLITIGMLFGPRLEPSLLLFLYYFFRLFFFFFFVIEPSRLAALVFHDRASSFFAATSYLLPWTLSTLLYFLPFDYDWPTVSI